uniref:Transmembrane protein n=1 Tax=Coccolithus braarudii TaxID=221442 RepID=A0A7S0L8M8_9EUKA
MCPKTCRKCHLHGKWSRRSSFFLVFGSVLFLAVVLVGACFRFADSFEKASTVAELRLARMSVRVPLLKRILAVFSVELLGRVMIATYVVNEGTTPWHTWLTAQGYNRQRLTYSWLFSFHHLCNYAAAVGGITCVLGFKPMASALVMLLDIVLDAYDVIGNIYSNWSLGRGLYINELMAKKVSLLGCVTMLVGMSLQKKRKKVFTGLLLESQATSLSASFALLAGRLLITFLFAFVGVSELGRLMSENSPYRDGDPHDTIWPKCVELILVIPFALGFHTSTTARTLAISLALEAMTAWSWSLFPLRWAGHSREHYVTNLATAGGLLLLQSLGGGRFTMDEMLRKKES